MTDTDKQSIGKLGEEIAVRYLKSRGFTVIDRNYSKKWGEIDVIAERGEVIHFIEVKTLTNHVAVNQKPEEHITPQKVKRLNRAIQSYLMEKKQTKADWQLDSLGIVLDVPAREARCRFLENIH